MTPIEMTLPEVPDREKLEDPELAAAWLEELGIDPEDVPTDGIRVVESTTTVVEVGGWRQATSMPDQRIEVERFQRDADGRFVRQRDGFVREVVAIIHIEGP